VNAPGPRQQPPPHCRRGLPQRFHPVIDGRLSWKPTPKTPASYDYNVAVTKDGGCGPCHRVSVEANLGCLGSLEPARARLKTATAVDGPLSRRQLLTDPAEPPICVPKQGRRPGDRRSAPATGPTKFTRKPTARSAGISRSPRFTRPSPTPTWDARLQLGRPTRSQGKWLTLIKPVSVAPSRNHMACTVEEIQNGTATVCANSTSTPTTAWLFHRVRRP